MKEDSQTRFMKLASSKSQNQIKTQQRKLETNIADEYRYKTSQQNIAKLHTAIYYKDHTP